MIVTISHPALTAIMNGSLQRAEKSSVADYFSKDSDDIIFVNEGNE
jgi:hypothetical protein